MSTKRSVWLVIHMAQSEERAERIIDMLTGEGLVAKAHPVYRNRPAEDNLYEIAVLKSESEEARGLLAERGFMN